MESERNRAMRCAYGWARKGERPMADLWIGVARQFAEPTEKQLARVEDLILAAKSRGVLPGQIDIEGRVAA